MVRATDDTLFNCPVIVASDAGTLGFTEAQADRLRQYFLKGGFLWADDFWGSAAWENWEYQIGRVLPADEYPIEDIPLDDRFQESVRVHEIPQITHIQFGGSGAAPIPRSSAPRGGGALPRYPDSHGASWC